MKISKQILVTGALALAFIVMQACSFSTANMSSFKVFSDKDGKTEASNFKTGDTINGRADISNNPGKVKVKFTLVPDKGDAIKGAEVTVDIDGDKTASYTLPVTSALPAGNYKLNAEMLNGEGEKKGSKTVSITVTQTAPVPAAEDHKSGDKDEDEK
jgi:hypothetical protein